MGTLCQPSTSSMMNWMYSIILCFVFALPSTLGLDNEEDRNEKLISTFQIVRFPNDVCIGSNSRNGTCYTSAECSDKGGTSSGSCADGFGVCCTFLITTCDSSSSENLTYWTQPTTLTTGTTCGLTVCPISDDICSIRLDFTKFTITGPGNAQVIQTRRTNGIIQGDLEDTAYDRSGSNFAGQCLLDSFTTQGASPSSTPPTVCGTMATNEHMYVEADTDRCNRFTFNIAKAATDAVADINNRGLAALATRSWDITFTQIECTSLTLPPPGCTQYFWGGGSYVLQTHNYVTADTTRHLANQHQRFCMRRERGNCLGCFHAVAAVFEISGTPAIAEIYTSAGGCCGYAGTMGGILGEEVNYGRQSGQPNLAAGENGYSWGFDCIIIPGAQGPTEEANEGAPELAQTTAMLSQTLDVAAGANVLPFPPQICGSGSGIGIGATTLEIAAGATSSAADTDVFLGIYNSEDNLTICTRNIPFVLEFMSDDLEGHGNEAGEANTAAGVGENKGFQITHEQIACA